VTNLFAHGDFRLYLLRLLADEPRHGYELIRLLEDELSGLYKPSPGSVYPRLSALEEDGLIERTEEEGRKAYRITEAGRAELDERREELDELERRVASAGDLAHDIRSEVRASVRELREELREALREVRGDVGDAVHDELRSARDQMRERLRGERRRIRVEARVHVDEGRELQRELRALREDARALVTDIVAAAQRHGIDREKLKELRAMLSEARARAVQIITNEKER
jgi:DNA-binding PadR family transcriptional regulator